MSNFFMRRPIVAMVISILMVIVGIVTIASLPVAQFPNIVPPEIQLQASYVGADAQALEQSVATPIEQQINGVDNMNYMYSLNATGNSQTTMVVDFDLKTDPNTDLILTQSREQLAAGQLPPDVNTYGVTIRKSVTAPAMLVGIFSKKLRSNPRTESYHKLPDKDMYNRCYEVYHDLGRWLWEKSDQAVQARFNELGQRRCEEGIPLAEVLWAPVFDQGAFARGPGRIRVSELGNGALSTARIR